jgi:uncharacterized protein (DUF952 family)
MSQPIYHITTQAEWSTATWVGVYTPQSFAQEGFIHCSEVHQLQGVRDRFFQGQTGLCLLVIDPTRLSKPAVYENLEGGQELFPHVYEPLAIAAVVEVQDL